MLGAGVSGGGIWSKPPGLVCYICGREFGTTSLKIHQPQCAKLFKDRQKLLPKSERRALPKPPASMTETNISQSNDGRAMTREEMDAFNAEQERVYREKSMLQCEHCGRRFLPEKLPVHHRSCTAEKPAKAVGTARIKPADPFNRLNQSTQSNNPSMSQSNNQPNTKLSGYQAYLAAGSNNVGGGYSPLKGIEESKSNDPRADSLLLPVHPPSFPSQNADSVTSGSPAAYNGPIASSGYDLSSISDMISPQGSSGAECRYCSRTFNIDRLAKHESICLKVKAKPSTVPQRPATAAPSNKPAKQKDEKWKAKHNEFQANIQYAKKLAAMQAAGVNIASLPPPPRSENPDFIQCPHCQRRFAPLAAERHIPACANTINKPKPPPQLRQQANQPQQSRERPKTSAPGGRTAPQINSLIKPPGFLTNQANNQSLSPQPKKQLNQTSPRPQLNPVRAPGQSAPMGANMDALQQQIAQLTQTVAMLAQNQVQNQSIQAPASPLPTLTAPMRRPSLSALTNAPQPAAASGCKSCHAPLNAGARFCSQCGSPQ